MPNPSIISNSKIRWSKHWVCQAHFQRRWLNLGLKGSDWNDLAKRGVLVFNHYVTNYLKIQWLKTTIITHSSAIWAGLGRNGPLCSIWHLLAGPSKIPSLLTCLAHQAGLTRHHHPLSMWPLHVASLGFLSSWWLQSGQLFIMWPASPKSKSRSFQTFLVPGLLSPRILFLPHFISQSSHRASPISRGEDCTGREHHEAWFTGVTGKGDYKKWLTQKRRCRRQ